MAIQLNHRQNRITTGSNAESAGVVLEVFNTGALILPKGTDAQRTEATEVAGAFRFNTTDNVLEYYNGTIWLPIAGGNTEDLRGEDNELIIDGVTVGATGVNHLQVSNAAEGNNVEVNAAGTDTDVSLDINAKGAGAVNIGDGTNTVASFQGAGATGLTITGGATSVEVSANGDLALKGNIVGIYDGEDKVAEFKNTGGDDALLIEAVTSGILITVSGADPKELFFGQNVDFQGNRVTGLADPSALQDAATKAYVDAAINGLDWKRSVRVATAANITLSGEQTIDDVAVVAGDRVLVRSQTDATENGIYVAAAGAWARSADADNSPSNEVSDGMATFVEEGTLYNSTGWVLTSPNGDANLGVDNLVFAQFAGPNSLTFVGGNGVDVTQDGNEYTFFADADGTTITAVGGTGDQLSVRSTGTAGEVLRSTGSDGQAATWGAIDLANQNAVEGILDVSNGGTGLDAVADQAILVGAGTSALSTLALGADNTFLKSDGGALVYASAGLADLSGVDVSAAVTGNVLVFDGQDWVDGTVNLASTDAVSGTLPVSNGGTGITALPQGHLVYGNGTDALETLTIGTASDSDSAFVLKTNTAGDAPEWGTLTLNQLADVSTSGATDDQVLQFNAGSGEWEAVTINLVDELVKANATDTTAGYLEDKVGVDDAGALTVATSANSRVQFSVNVDDTTVGKVSNNLAVRSTGTEGQVLRSNGVDGEAATWGALDLANADAVTGVLEVTNGGTGLAEVSAEAILIGTGTTELKTLDLGVEGTFLRSNGVTLVYASAQLNDIDGFNVTGQVSGQALVWDGDNWVNGAINLASDDAVSGILDVANGGTGLDTVAENDLLVGAAGNTLVTLGAGTASTAADATVLTVDTAGDLAWGGITIDQLSNVAITLPTDEQVLQYNSATATWENVSIGELDRLVRISPTDTTSGYLNGKLVAGDGADLTVGNAAGDETLTVTAVGDETTVGVNVSGIYVRSTATTGQVLRSTGVDGDAATWGALDLANTDAVTGTLALTNGGTGLATIAARSVLVADTADTLTALQAPDSGNQLLRWNSVGGAYEFVSQDLVGGFAFETFVMAGNGNAAEVSATQTSDTLEIKGGQGVAVSGGTKSIEFALTTEGLTTGTATSESLLTFFNGTDVFVASADTFLADLGVPVVPAGTGLVVQSPAGEYVVREIVANTSADRAGVEILDTQGSAGNITVGLNLNGLAETAVTSDDFVVFVNSTGTTNGKVSVSALLAVNDATRIQDAAGTTFVDTDEVANKVVVQSNDGKVAEFTGAAANADYFIFDTATSAQTLRIEASGTSTDIDIRLVPKGNGEVFIGDAGDGTIQAEDTFDLTLAGGNDGGDLVLKGGTSAGQVLIQNPAGDALVTFGDDNSITHYSTNAESYSKDLVVRLTTTGAGTATATETIPTNGTVLLDGYVVARETGLGTTDNHLGYKFKAVVYNTGGTATVLESVVEEVIAATPAALDVAVSVNAGNAVITVTGATGVNMTWTVIYKAVTIVS